MDLRQIRAFVAVARERSFTRAAETLHIAQPAVSMAIARLEDELELTLFNRQKKQVGLTAEGEVFARHAERILGDCLAADAEMAEMARDEVAQAQADLDTLNTELQTLLLPRDPDDHRNAFLEIRAGTGGDEGRHHARRRDPVPVEPGAAAGPPRRARRRGSPACLAWARGCRHPCPRARQR